MENTSNWNRCCGSSVCSNLPFSVLVNEAISYDLWKFSAKDLLMSFDEIERSRESTYSAAHVWQPDALSLYKRGQNSPNKLKSLYTSIENWDRKKSNLRQANNFGSSFSGLVLEDLGFGQSQRNFNNLGMFVN